MIITIKIIMDGEPKFNPQDITPKNKYTVGAPTKHWGEPDEFNEELRDAQESGLVDATGCLTEKGIKYLEEFDVQAQENKFERQFPLSTHLSENTVGEFSSSDPTPSKKLTFETSGLARANKLDVDREHKGIIDGIFSVLEDRGFKVDAVDLKEDMATGHEKRFILEIKYKSGNGNDGNNKRRTLRLVGSQHDIVKEIGQGDLNLPTTIRPEKVRRARRKAS